MDAYDAPPLQFHTQILWQEFRSEVNKERRGCLDIITAGYFESAWLGSDWYAKAQKF